MVHRIPYPSITLKPVLVLVVVSLLTFLCHLTTIKHYPISWQDEVDIIECGRFSTYDQHPEWSMNLIPTRPASMPAPLIHYFGGFVQETLYRNTGSFIAPRCFAVSGLLFAVALFFVWLRKKGLPPWTTLFSALLLLSDTNVTVGVHWYRLDMWVMGFTFINALLVLRCSGKTESIQLKTLFAVGAIMVFQAFFWLTAVVQWPLVFAEVLGLAVSEKWTAKRYLRAALAGLLGMSAALIVFLFPLYGEIKNTIDSVLTQSEIGRIINRLSFSPSEGSTTGFLQDAVERLLGFIKLILRSPFIWVGAAIGCFFLRKHPFHFAALLLSSAVVISTQVYHARVNYLTPLAFLFFTEGLYQCLTKPKPPCLRYLAIAFLATALSFSFGLSVIALNYFARPLTPENTYDALLEKMDTVIGRGPKHVYTFTYDFYHVGRRLGWHMYSFLPSWPESLFASEVSAPLLRDLEYIIISDDYKDLTASQTMFLNGQGFFLWKRLELPPDKPTGLTAHFRKIMYAGGYPSFAIWRKAEQQKPDLNNK